MLTLAVISLNTGEQRDGEGRVMMGKGCNDGVKELTDSTIGDKSNTEHRSTLLPSLTSTPPSACYGADAGGVVMCC